MPDKAIKYKNSALSTLFYKTYVPEISKKVIDAFGDSYITFNDLKDSWRKQLNYSKAASDYLILETKTFIRLLDQRNQDSTNPQFLDSLTGLMADYLSVYFVRSAEASTQQDVIKDLKDKFYHQNNCIQFLLTQQKKRRAAKRKKNTEIMCAIQQKKEDHERAIKLAADKFLEIGNSQKSLFIKQHTK